MRKEGLIEREPMFTTDFELSHGCDGMLYYVCLIDGKLMISDFSDIHSSIISFSMYLSIYFFISSSQLHIFNLYTVHSSVNSISIHHKEKGLIAIGDDEKIIIIDSLHQKQRVFTRLHSNIISKIAFKPNASGEIASCGFDYVYNAWDYRTGKSRFKVNSSEWLAEQTQESANGSTQFTNPPFFHDFVFVNKGKQSVCVLGDGHLVLLDNNQGHCITREKGHDGMVTNIESKGVGGNVCITGGVDKIVKIWNVSDVEISIVGGFAHTAKINCVKCLNKGSLNSQASMAELGKVFIADASISGDISVVEATS